MAKKFQTSKVLTVSAGHFFHDVHAAFLAPMIPLLMAKYGISLSMVGLLDIIRKVPSLFNPLLGLLADSFCFRYFVILAPAITGSCMCLLGTSSNYTVLFILLFISGLSSTLFHIPSPVLIKQFSGDKVASGMSFYMFGGEMARTAGPLIITAALSWWGLEGSFRLLPIGFIASLVLYLRLKNISSIHSTKKQQKKVSVGKTLKALTPFLIFLAGFHFFRSGMKSSVTLFFPAYLVAQGESLWFAGVALSVLQLSGSLGMIVTGYVSDKISHRKTLLIVSVLCPLIMWLLIIADRAFTLPLLFVFGLVLFAPGPVLLALVHEVKTERPAFVNSIYMTINFAVGAVMVFAVGLLGDKLGLDLTFKISATIALLSIPFLLLVPKVAE